MIIVKKNASIKSNKCFEFQVVRVFHPEKLANHFLVDDGGTIKLVSKFTSRASESAISGIAFRIFVSASACSEQLQLRLPSAIASR